jgi:hypothetical protein
MVLQGNGNAREQQQRLTILYSLAREEEEARVEFSSSLILAGFQYASAVCGVHVYVLCVREEKLSRGVDRRTRQGKARAWLHMIDIPRCCHCWGRLSGRLISNSEESSVKP